MHPWHTDAYQRTDDVVVHACTPVDGGFRVRTSPTILYPEGGGQPADHGSVGGARVLDVQRDDEGVVHLTDAPVAVGPAAVVLDWARRFDHMQQHTGQHLLSAILQDRLGAATTSFHLGAGVCAIELDVVRLPVSLDVVEAMVDAEIRAARPVRQRQVEPDALGHLPVRSRGLPEGLTGLVRLVEIEGVDLNTCGGTHLHNTAELQQVALLGAEPARGGLRVTFVAGGRAAAAFRLARAQQEALTRLLSTPPADHVSTVQRGLEERRELSRRIAAAESELATAWASSLASLPGPVIAAHRDDVELAWLQGVAGMVMGARPEALLLLTSAPSGSEAGSFLLAGDPERVRSLGPEVATRLGGRGGGAKGRFQGRADALGGRHDVAAWLSQPHRP